MKNSENLHFFLDVREEDEFSQDSVPKSFNMPLRKVLSVGYGFSNGFWKSFIPKDKLVIVYCSTGRRAKRACQALNEGGYKIKNMHTLEEAKKFYNTIAN